MATALFAPPEGNASPAMFGGSAISYTCLETLNRFGFHAATMLAAPLADASLGAA